MNKTITLEFPEKKQEALSHFLKKKDTTINTELDYALARNVYDERPIERVPLSENPDFKPIRNAVVRAAVELDVEQRRPHPFCRPSRRRTGGCPQSADIQQKGKAR